MEIGIIGLGKLGLPLALVFSKYGFEVKGYDKDPERVRQIERNEPFLESKLNNYLDEYGSNLKVSTDILNVKDSSAIFIIVQTPSLQSGFFDLSYVREAVKDIHQVNPECVVAVSSSINVGDTEKLRRMHRRICYNPEFVRQGTVIDDFENPKFTLIGAYNREDADSVSSIWRKIHSKRIFITTPTEAEIAKISSNVSFALGITFANILGEVCEKFRVDPAKVLEIVYSDRRNYMPGLGFGGPCFPRDVRCFGEMCLKKEVRSGFHLSALLQSLNDYTVNRYLEEIRKQSGRNIAIIGVAYKAGISLIDGSQSLMIAEKLAEENYKISIYDPLAEGNAKKRLMKGDVRFYRSLEECLNQVETVFMGIPFDVPRDLLEGKNVIDPWRSVKKKG